MRRPFASKLVVVATACTLAAAPALVFTTAANAATTIVVTTPTNNATGVQQSFPNVTQFEGTGVPEGEQAYVTYLDANGVSHPATFGGGVADADGDWSGLENFGELSPGQTHVVATVVARDVNTLAIDATAAPATVTFDFDIAPVSANPFVVTAPVSNSTTPVEDTTPEFSGTGEPGDTIVITYGARSLQTAVAATTVVDENGDWSTQTDFSAMEPGDTEGSAIVTEYLDYDNGVVQPGTSGLRINFVFPSAPAAAVPLTLTVAPKTLTQAAASSTGVGLVATGFSPNEEVLVTLKDANGNQVVLPATTAHLYTNVQDGSFAGTAILPTTAGTGLYTVTVTGVRSARTVSATFTVTANPVTPGTGVKLPIVSG